MRLLAAAVLLIAAATAQAADWMDMAYKHLGIETHEVKSVGFIFPTIPELADLEATYVARGKERIAVQCGPPTNATPAEKAECIRLRSSTPPGIEKRFEDAGDAYRKAKLAYLAKRMAETGLSQQKMQEEATTANSATAIKQQHVER